MEKLSERLWDEAHRLIHSYIDPGFPRNAHSKEVRELLNEAYKLALRYENGITVGCYRPSSESDFTLVLPAPLPEHFKTVTIIQEEPL